ncbi:hypothetical protein [Methylobacterium fujisawaense]
MYDEASRIFSALIEQMPKDIPLDDPEPDAGAPETGSARTAR